MGITSRTLALAASLTAAGCDAPTSGGAEPAKTVAPPPEQPAPRPDAKSQPPTRTPPIARRPVVPGYLAPPDANTEPKPTPPPDVPPVATPPADQPKWAELLAESDALSRSGVWDNMGPARIKEAEAFAEIRALPDSDPRFVEAQCVLAQRGNVGADVEAALLAGIARLRAAPPADKYAFLDRDDLLTTEPNATIADDGAVSLAPQTILTSAGDCAAADIAMLTMELIESYHGFAMFAKAYAGTPPPDVPDAFRAASQTLLDFHAELVREYSNKHPRPAALVERLYWACHWSHRKKHPKICFPEQDEHRAFEQALAAREAALGEDHPLTRASLLRVGAARLAAGKADEARALLTRASAGEIDRESEATAAMLLALLALSDKKTDDALAQFARIEPRSDRIFGADWYAHAQALQLHSSALRASKHYPEALRVYRRYLAVQPAPPPGSKRTSAPGFAELLAEAGARDEALAEYAVRIAAALELEQTGANAPARQMGRDQRLADLRARADLHRRMGNAAAAEADLAEVRALEQGPPVPPD